MFLIKYFVTKIKSFHLKRNPELINGAIEYLAKNREESNSKLVYPHDLFYRKVSKIQDIFNALFLIQNEVIKVNSNEQSINYLLDTTNFLSVTNKTTFKIIKS